MIRVLRIIIFFGLTACFAATAATSIAEVYQNEEYGMTIPVPADALLCPASEQGHSHGPLLLLATSSAKRCNNPQKTRSITVFAGHNADEVTKTLDDFIRWQCTRIGGKPCRPVPADLKIPGLTIATGRVDRSDGWTTTLVVARAGAANDDSDSVTPPTINYTFGLNTKRKYLEKDIDVFRRILQSVRLRGNSLALRPDQLISSNYDTMPSGRSSCRK